MVIRTNIRKERESHMLHGFTYSLHTDSNGPLSSREFVVVRPINHNDQDWNIVRWFHFDEQSDQYERNFGRKVCTDEEYRKNCIDGTADWAIISDVLESIEQELYIDLFQRGSLDKEQVTDLIEKAFTYIKAEVRENGRSEISESEVMSHISGDIVCESI